RMTMSRSVMMPCSRLSLPQIGSEPTLRSRIICAAFMRVSSSLMHSAPKCMMSRAVVMGPCLPSPDRCETTPRPFAIAPPRRGLPPTSLIQPPARPGPIRQVEPQPLLRSEQAEPAGGGGGLAARGHLQLGDDVGDVHARRLRRDVQGLGDAAVAAALGDQAQHLA